MNEYILSDTHVPFPPCTSMQQIEGIELIIFGVFPGLNQAPMLGPMYLGGIKRALGRACQDVLRHHTLQVSAALSYYFVLSIFIV